jgi:hypothetical protein
MNAPAAGWNPDPTGRHEYRYWDGSTWTDDVSDSGVTSVDPIAGPAPRGDDPTAPLEPTQRYDSPFGPQQGGFGPQPGPQPGGFGPSSGTSGQYPPSKPVKSGPSTGLIVGLAALAVALIAGIVFVLASGGDDDDGDTATDDTSGTDDTSAEDTSTDDTSSDDTSTDDTGEDLDLDLGDVDEDDSDDAIVDIMAAGIESSSDRITPEQAQCAAQAMVDELGLDTIMEMSTSGQNPFEDGSMSTDDQLAIINAMTDCIPVDVLMELGVDAEG